MAKAQEEGLDGRLSAEGRVACKSGHDRWLPGVVLSVLLGDERLKEVEVSPLRDRYSFGVAEQTHASNNVEQSHLV